MAKPYQISELKTLLNAGIAGEHAFSPLPPLFSSKEEYILWKEKRNIKHLERTNAGANLKPAPALVRSNNFNHFIRIF